ncbi:MAG: hypothetical protein C7B46_20665, partial [Sulfobacillus benefaciens]
MVRQTVGVIRVILKGSEPCNPDNEVLQGLQETIESQMHGSKLIRKDLDDEVIYFFEDKKIAWSIGTQGLDVFFGYQALKGGQAKKVFDTLRKYVPLKMGTMEFRYFGTIYHSDQRGLINNATETLRDIFPDNGTLEFAPSLSWQSADGQQFMGFSLYPIIKRAVKPLALAMGISGARR